MPSKPRASLLLVLVAFPLALALAACGTTGDSAGARVVVEDELPEREREVWRSYQAGGPEWIVERERVRDDPRLSAFLVDNLVRQMVRAYDRSSLTPLGRPGEGPFERARAELVELSDVSTPVLAELVRVGDGVVAYLARDLLVEIGEPAVVPVAGLTEDERETVRRRAAEALGMLPLAADEDAVQERLTELAHDDPSWIVRAQATQSLALRGRLEPESDRVGQVRRALVAVLTDEDPKVVETAAEGLAALGDPRAIPALADLMERSIEAGKLGPSRAAQDALRRLSGGQDLRNPREWRRFWNDNRRELTGR